VKAGNEPPVVSFNLLKGNRTFYFPNDTIRYDIKVSDKEDGSLQNGRILPSQVALSFNYMPIGYDQIELSQTHRDADNTAFTSAGKVLLNRSDCKSCHVQNKTSIGPSYLQIANKYKSTPAIVDRLAKKVISGGSGVWGDHAMSAHPQLAPSDAKAIVEYILSINQKQAVVKRLPLKGTYITKIDEENKDKGTYILRAAYRDRGTATMSPLVGEEVLVLRNPQLNPELADKSKGVHLITTLAKALYMEGNNAYLAYNDLDLTGIKAIQISAAASGNNDPAGGLVEVRLDEVDGTLLGQTSIMEPGRGAKPFNGYVTIKPTAGKHKVFFVFKNEKARENQILMQVYNITFVNK
jgi:cytochrome c